MSKSVIYSIISIILFTAFFYFYPANIFEADITGEGSTVAVDIALKGFLDSSYLPSGINVENVTKVSPSIKGILLLIICLIGLPIMIGYRVATNSEKAKNKKEN